MTGETHFSMTKYDADYIREIATVVIGAVYEMLYESDAPRPHALLAARDAAIQALPEYSPAGPVVVDVSSQTVHNYQCGCAYVEMPKCEVDKETHNHPCPNHGGYR